MLRKLLCLLFVLSLTFVALPAHAQKQSYSESVFYNFCSQANCADGSSLYNDNLIQGSDGNYYGTTLNGGNLSASLCNGAGCGTIYRITPAGVLTTLYTFCTQANCDDGSFASALIQGSDGNFYGTTLQGGAHSIPNYTSAGTIFKITPSGTFTTLYNFCSQTNCTDGFGPISALVQGTDGNFYGTTVQGGSATNCTYGCGTFFKITPTGALTTLHDFCTTTNCADGAEPRGALVEGADGNFYSYTTGDVEGNVVLPSTIFKVTPAGAVTTLYGFCATSSCPNGTGPTGSLVLGSDGNFYGVTASGGLNNSSLCSTAGCGTAYKITPGGTFTSLYKFCSQSNCTDGLQPIGGLLQASDGNFYGTADTPNDYGAGVVFAMTPSGTMTTAYTFCDLVSCEDGLYPDTSLIQPVDGNLYGLTSAGGATANCAFNECGAIYKITPSPVLTPQVTAPAPVYMQLSQSQITLGDTVVLAWEVLNGYSLTMQQCYAFVQNNAAGAGTWTGLQTGLPNESPYQGGSPITPTANGVYTYALTCGGVETGFATLQVGDTKPTAVLSLTATNLVYPGSTVSLLATISGQQGFPAPTGSVTFTVNGTSVGTLTVVDGASGYSLDTTGFPIGSYTVKAAYSGDSNYAGSSATKVVNLQGYPTQTTLSAYPTTFVQGQTVALSTTVSRTAPYQGTAPTGTVTFYAGARAIGSATLSGGSASLSYTTNNSIPAGTYSVVAKYSGDASDTVSTSPATQVTVQSSANLTYTNLYVSPTTVAQGQSVLLAASVLNQTTPPATGTVTFYANNVVVGSGTLSDTVVNLNGTVSPSIAAGTYSVVAKYSGDAHNQPSTSATVSVTVLAATATTLTVVPNPVPANHAVTISTTVQEKYQSAIPIGSVVFSVGSRTVATAVLKSGSGSVNVSDSGIAPGTYPLTATYSGDTNNASSSTTMNVTVQ